ncbi:MAG TPA: hypothetical protein VK193_06235, partial [Methyloceanibacter sp.]|nr:hypothetical protein [Methyloceanibacter sp.]
MPDYPIPAKAREAYSPIQEGFESPIDPRGDLKAAASYVDERAERLKEGRAEQGPFVSDTDSLRRTAAPIGSISTSSTEPTPTRSPPGDMYPISPAMPAISCSFAPCSEGLKLLAGWGQGV